MVVGGIVAIASTFSATAVAEQGKAGTGPNPFRDCGIGGALFPDTHWAAITSNVIWDVGTTAITSATLSPSTCNGSSAKAAKLINDAYDSVIEDTARGRGEYVAALLEIYGCDNSAQPEIIDAIRLSVTGLITADGYSALSQIEKAENYYKAVDSKIRGDFVSSCTA